MSTVEVVKQTGFLDLSVNQLTFDSDVQCRESIHMGVVADYREALASNAVFPPLVVFHDGRTYWVADGFHRGAAYRETGASKCPCDVRNGTKRDAILYAVGANREHGFRRSNADKRRAVETLLKDAEWSRWTDSEIAKRCGVHHSTIDAVRSSCGFSKISPTEPRKAIRNGKEYEINTSNIGKTKPSKVAAKSAPEPAWKGKVHGGLTPEAYDADCERLEPLMVELQKKDPEAFEKVCAGKIDGEAALEAARAKEKPKAKPVEPTKSLATYAPVNTDTLETLWGFAEEYITETWNRCEPLDRPQLAEKIETLLSELKERAT